ncbi:hypothetical protein BG011_003136 [Mortierella polycephala]|uniref:RNI-like protein n=1 Tax=Mortierella polycephala TaxID=41804 RepID=A0A9P6UA19_9FUNG|nr:hypothetical protein BG011_003136 [Mortierella polycephala]
MALDIEEIRYLCAIRVEDHIPAVEQLQKYCHRIRHLELVNATTEYHRIINLTNLKTLTFDVEESLVRDWGLRRMMVKRSKRTLQRVELSLTNVKLDRSAWNEIVNFAKVDVLRMKNGVTLNLHLSDFFKVISLVSELHLTYLSLPWTAMDLRSMEKGLPRLQHIDFYNVGTSDDVLLELLLRSRSLVSMIWINRSNSDPTGTAASVGAELIRRFGDRYWPRLRTLILNGCFCTSDEGLATILRSMAPAETLGLEDSVFGPRSFYALMNGDHMGSLRVLNLCHARGVQSLHVLGILVSAPMLEQFMAPSIYVEDIIHKKRWVCTRLKTLVVGIKTRDYSDRNSRAWRELTWRDRYDVEDAKVLWSADLMEALSRLEQLEVLDLRLHWWCSFNAFELDLTVRGESLTKLGTLSRLRRFLFNTAKVAHEEDVEWMMQHWPRLTCIHGNLSCPSQVDTKLMDIFKQHDMCFERHCKNAKHNGNDRGTRNCNSEDDTPWGIIDYSDAMRTFHGL